MNRFAIPGLAIAALAATPGLARDDEPAAAPAVFQAVIDCRAVADPAARLACYDRSVGAMAQAGEKRDLVVLDRETMRETRKGLFGISLPKLRLFGGNDEGGQDEVTEIESTIAAISIASDGYPLFTTAEGARWKQSDGRKGFAKVGDSIRIRKAAFGSFLANVKDRVAIRVVRLP